MLGWGQLGQIIVSGLVKICDACAHSYCLAQMFQERFHYKKYWLYKMRDSKHASP